MPDANPHALPDLATNSLEAFEKYFDRKPLNDELAEILAGKRAEEIPNAVTQEGTVKVTERIPRAGLLDWTPTRKQAAALAETVGTEGWAIFLELMKKRLEVLRETAITVSQNDPLRNKDAIAEEWAYHGVYRKVLSDIGPIVQEQLDRLRVVE
jgi:hypothetical protein